MLNLLVVDHIIGNPNSDPNPILNPNPSPSPSPNPNPNLRDAGRPPESIIEEWNRLLGSDSDQTGREQQRQGFLDQPHVLPYREWLLSDQVSDDSGSGTFMRIADRTLASRRIVATACFFCASSSLTHLLTPTRWRSGGRNKWESKAGAGAWQWRERQMLASAKVLRSGQPPPDTITRGGRSSRCAIPFLFWHESYMLYATCPRHPIPNPTHAHTSSHRLTHTTLTHSHPTTHKAFLNELKPDQRDELQFARGDAWKECALP